MKLKQLVGELQGVQTWRHPKSELEQYPTPPDIAAHMLLAADAEDGDEDEEEEEESGMLCCCPSSLFSRSDDAERVVKKDIDHKDDLLKSSGKILLHL